MVHQPFSCRVQVRPGRIREGSGPLKPCSSLTVCLATMDEPTSTTQETVLLCFTSGGLAVMVKV